ncbi:MAG: DUF1016 family protein [Eggerthellaceae bacterium]|nr:DUF1016 family protein [Eggerthellaceae bacterium]
MIDHADYNDAVQTIKQAILQSQYQAAKGSNAVQLRLYYAVGEYVAANSREGHWGQGALRAISERLQRELPGLRGFSERNLKYMRTFFEEWSPILLGSNSAEASAELESPAPGVIRQLRLPNYDRVPVEGFLSIGFSHHCLILSSVKDAEERVYYVKRCAQERMSVDTLKQAIKQDAYRHQGALPNNFTQTLSTPQQALRAIDMFKDEYLLDFINVEELGVRDAADVDERVVEQAIVHNVKNFIMAFGRAFTFVSNQYHLDAFGVDQYIDLLFFNRDLNCLVAVELKSGPFKTAYLGQLSGYLSVLNGFERKEHENPPIGIILCKDMDKAFVDYMVQDYKQPLGVATYKTSKDMSEELLRALPPIEDLERLLESAGE